jgi:hypothetical protein
LRHSPDELRLARWFRYLSDSALPFMKQIC